MEGGCVADVESCNILQRVRESINMLLKTEE